MVPSAHRASGKKATAPIYKGLGKTRPRVELQTYQHEADTLTTTPQV